MKYKFTLLKDLPDYPAGSIFYSGAIEVREDKQYYRYTAPGSPYCQYCEVGGILDDPTWYRKEINWDALHSLQCLICGETRCTYEHVVELYKDNWGDDARCLAVRIEYACGHPAKELRFRLTGCKTIDTEWEKIKAREAKAREEKARKIREGFKKCEHSQEAEKHEI